MRKDSSFPFIYNNGACPSDPCSHMHTHADVCTLFQGRFSPQAMGNIQQVQSSKNQTHLFSLRNHWPHAISDIRVYMECCGIIPLLRNWSCSYYIQVSFASKKE